MDVWNYIAFSKITHRGLWDYVQKHNIPVNHREDLHMASIEIYASDPHWAWIEAYWKGIGRNCQSDTVFTKDEIQQADWMRVRSIWRTGYPMPMDGFKYETITYTRDRYCAECGIGLEQVDSFRIKKIPTWGRRHFFSLFWVDDEFFVSETVKNSFQDAGITGVSFEPVLDTKGKNVHKGIFQMRIETTLENGLIDTPQNLRDSSICAVCGRRKSRINVGIRCQFKQHIFDNAPDIVKTGDYFGVAGNKGPSRDVIISQKVYQTIVKNQLEKNLIFYPIELV